MAVDSQNVRLLTICLRIPQLVLASICLGIVYTASANVRLGSNYGVKVTAESGVLSFLTITSTYLTPSFLLLVATLHRESFELMRKTIFEIVYNIFGAIIQSLASLILLTYAGRLSSSSSGAFYAAGIMGLINAGLYFGSFFISVKAKKVP